MKLETVPISINGEVTRAATRSAVPKVLIILQPESSPDYLLRLPKKLEISILKSSVVTLGPLQQETSDFMLVVMMKLKSISQRPSSLNKTALEKIIDIDSSTPYKFYFTQTSQISSEIPLTQDNLYYMEIYHLEASGSDFSTVGVQVPINNPTKPAPEAQSLKIVCPTDYEILEFKMTEVQGGLGRIRFDSVTQDGTRISYSTWTRSMTYNASAVIVQNYLNWDIVSFCFYIICCL